MASVKYVKLTSIYYLHFTTLLVRFLVYYSKAFMTIQTDFRNAAFVFVLQWKKKNICTIYTEIFSSWYIFIRIAYCDAQIYKE